MKIISTMLVAVIVMANVACAQDSEYNHYLQEFIDQAKELQTIKDKSGDISYEQFDKRYETFNNEYNKFKGKYSILAPNPDERKYKRPSYKLVEAMKKSLFKCSSNIYLNELDKADYEAGRASYSGLNKNKFCIVK